MSSLLTKTRKLDKENFSYKAEKIQPKNPDALKECPKCKESYIEEVLADSLYVCPNCGHHMAISAKQRIQMLADAGSFKEQGKNIVSGNPLRFPSYRNKLVSTQEENGNKDALVTGVCTIQGTKTAIAVLDSTFMMGSMGTVVGEKFTMLTEFALKNKLPLVAVSASGGARMQEGMFSLVQMAKTSAAIEKFSKHGGFFISVLTHPTMGGVSASFAMLGDVILVEPKARIGFAGPRVIEQTIGQTLPKGFQKSEFQQEHGFVDRVVERKDLRGMVGRLLAMHGRS